MHMEGQDKGMNGFESVGKEVRVANKRGARGCESLLRLVAMALTLSAAVILGVDRQTKVVPIQVVDTLPPLHIPVSAKWHYLSAFVFFVVSNAVASAYAAISLVLSATVRRGSNAAFALFAVDVAMVGLLFSSNGAAVAIGLMGFEGNSHVQWKKVCDVFGKFCNQGAAALVISLVGSIAFLLLVVVAAKRLHRKN